jgi:hypothetical protein
MNVLKHSVAIGAMALVGLITAPGVHAGHEPEQEDVTHVQRSGQVPGDAAGWEIHVPAPTSSRTATSCRSSTKTARSCCHHAPIPIRGSTRPVTRRDLHRDASRRAGGGRSWFYPGNTIGDEFIT